MTSPAAWVYLSPHLDDAVLSCGGLIAAQVRLGHPVLILTVCAGDPPAGELTPLARVLHERWQTGLQTAAVRRAEDLAACARLGAAARHLDLPDCIYRRSPKTGFPVISANEDLFAPIHPDEIPLVAALAERLRGELPDGATNVVSPLSLGGHMDHRLVRAAAEQLSRPLWYYADFPYAANPAAGGVEDPSGLYPPRARIRCFKVSKTALAAWGEAVSAYPSQISTFWPDEAAMRASLADFTISQGGLCLWASARGGNDSFLR